MSDDGGSVDPPVRHTHEEVRAAVLALLAEDGLDSVRHGRIAERSAASRATVYRHWPHRAALLISTLEAMRPQLDLPDPSGDLRTDIRTLVRTVATNLNENQMLADMLVLLRQADDDPDFAVVRQHVVPLKGNLPWRCCRQHEPQARSERRPGRGADRDLNSPAPSHPRRPQTRPQRS